MGVAEVDVCGEYIKVVVKFEEWVYPKKNRRVKIIPYSGSGLILKISSQGGTELP